MKQHYDENYFRNRKANEGSHYKVMRMTKRILRHKPISVLDVGCGHGFLVKHLRSLGIDARGCDFVPHAGSEIPEHFTLCDAKSIPFEPDTFDLVVSFDFFEHIPEEDIDEVYAEMLRVGKKVLAVISDKPDKLMEGETVDTHLTVKPKSWWKERLPGCIIY